MKWKGWTIIILILILSGMSFLLFHQYRRANRAEAEALTLSDSVEVILEQTASLEAEAEKAARELQALEEARESERAEVESSGAKPSPEDRFPGDLHRGSPPSFDRGLPGQGKGGAQGPGDPILLRSSDFRFGGSPLFDRGVPIQGFGANRSSGKDQPESPGGPPGDREGAGSLEGSRPARVLGSDQGGCRDVERSPGGWGHHRSPDSPLGSPTMVERLKGRDPSMVRGKE